MLRFRDPDDCVVELAVCELTFSGRSSGAHVKGDLALIMFQENQRVCHCLHWKIFFLWQSLNCSDDTCSREKLAQRLARVVMVNLVYASE